ncbi:hypothetical protein PR003_g33158 [Phytophthora rubi]|uniref:Uncharacterized protein n=1 Tax=Phytophthora rubi TaxID=129364 RepID=A0A6A4AXQ6_9STRA|nr:hypothetical protein PR003_g33158 [Phytophthora rubi]
MGGQALSQRIRRAPTWVTPTCRPRRASQWPEESYNAPSISRAGTLTVLLRERGQTLALVPLLPLQVRLLSKEARANGDPRLEPAATC